MLSDTDSSDSDNGIRFKTTSTRRLETFTTSSDKNGLKYDNWRSRDDHSNRSSRDEHSDRDRRSQNERRIRRSESRERRHHQSPDKARHSTVKMGSDQRGNKFTERRRSKSREKNQPSSSSTERKRSKSKERQRDEKKLEKSIKKPSMEAEKIDGTSTVDDPHKVKKSKHKKHKRSKRDESELHRKDATKISINQEDEVLSKDTGSDAKRSPQIKIGNDAPPETSRNTSDDELQDVCGPSLPPHLRKSSDEVEPKTKMTSSYSEGGGKRIMGPAAPPPSQLLDTHDLNMSDISESEDDSLIGPFPVDTTNKSEAHLELEKRAIELKLAKFDERENSKKTKVREEWMLELPDVKLIADAGLGARQFRTKERPDLSDRSSWTDTPKDKSQKSQHRKELTADEVRKIQQNEANAVYNAQRDAEQEAAAKRHKKKHKRDESLLEIHQKKLKKRKEKEDLKPLRRPFSRDADLKVNRFDQAQKNAILKKAQLLDTRFGSGETKYL